MHLRFRQVRYFVEIVDAGSMTRAAERLNLAPTALSLQIKALEEEFSVRLLERHARGVSPTTLGRLFYAQARALLAALAEAEHLLASTGHAPVRFRLGISPSVLHAIGLRTLLCGDGAGGGMDVVEGPSAELIDRLVSGDIDFALGWIGPAQPMVAMVDVVEEALVFVAARAAGFPEGPVALADALAADPIRLGRQNMSWDLVCRRAAADGLQPRPARVVESDDLARRILRDGLGTAILPIGFVDPERRAGGLAVHAIAGEPLTRRLSFAWRETTPWGAREHAALAHVETLIADFLARTAPHSAALASLAGIRSGAAERGTA